MLNYQRVIGTVPPFSITWVGLNVIVHRSLVLRLDWDTPTFILVRAETAYLSRQTDLPSWQQALLVVAIMTVLLLWVMYVYIYHLILHWLLYLLYHHSPHISISNMTRSIKGCTPSSKFCDSLPPASLRNSSRWLLVTSMISCWMACESSHGVVLGTSCSCFSYPLVIIAIGNSPFPMGKSTINGHFP